MKILRDAFVSQFLTVFHRLASGKAIVGVANVDLTGFTGRRDILGDLIAP